MRHMRCKFQIYTSESFGHILFNSIFSDNPMDLIWTSFLDVEIVWTHFIQQHFSDNPMDLIWTSFFGLEIRNSPPPPSPDRPHVPRPHNRWWRGLVHCRHAMTAWTHWPMARVPCGPDTEF